MLWNALSVAWAVHPSTGRQAAWALGDGVILFTVAANVRETALSINWPLLFVGASLPAMIAGMILEKDFASLFPNANLLGGYVLMILFIPWMIFLGSPNTPEGKEKKVISLVLAVLGTVILYRSGSRTAILTWLLMMGATQLRPQGKRYRQWLLLGLGAVVSWMLISSRKILILSSLVDRWFGAFMSRGKVLGSSPFQDRWRWWASAARVFQDHPLAGVGIGNFGVVAPLYAKTKTLHSLFAHSLPLQILSETGLTGFLVTLGLVLYGVRWMRSAPRNAVQKGLALGISAALIENLVDYNLSAPAHWLLFGWMLGLACPAREPAGDSFWRKDDGSLKPALAAVMVGLIFLGMEASSRPWRAHRWTQQGTIDLGLGRTEAVRDDLRRARRLDPTSLEALGLSFRLQSQLSRERGLSHLEQAEAELNEWRAVPVTGALWKALAKLWEERGERERAKTCVSAAVAVNPLLTLQR